LPVVSLAAFMLAPRCAPDIVYLTNGSTRSEPDPSWPGRYGQPVMAGLVPAIHASLACGESKEDVDAPDQPGHDGGEVPSQARPPPPPRRANPRHRVCAARGRARGARRRLDRAARGGSARALRAEPRAALPRRRRGGARARIPRRAGGGG